MEKKEKRKEYANLFEGPWCPLFGALPSYLNFPPNSQVTRCINIIKDARVFWEVQFDNWTQAHNWPKPEELYNYHPEVLMAARDIYRDWLGICRDATSHFQQPSAYHKKENGHSELSNSLDTVNDDLLLEIVRSRCYGYWIEDGVEHNVSFSKLPLYAIKSMLAIAIAHYVIERVLYYEYSEDTPEIVNDTQIAQNLLSKAKEMILESHANRGKKIIRSASIGGREKKNSDKIKHKHRIWTDTIKEYIEEHSHITSKSRIAEGVIKRLNNRPDWQEIKVSHGYLRKFINKVS